MVSVGWCAAFACINVDLTVLQWFTVMCHSFTCALTYGVGPTLSVVFIKILVFYNTVGRKSSLCPVEKNIDTTCVKMYFNIAVVSLHLCTVSKIKKYRHASCSSYSESEFFLYIWVFLEIVNNYIKCKIIDING